eukprot:Lankesteria_metandrocarpae@DN997_c0_g1_i1.p1
MGVACGRGVALRGAVFGLVVWAAMALHSFSGIVRGLELHRISRSDTAGTAPASLLYRLYGDAVPPALQGMLSPLAVPYTGAAPPLTVAAAAVQNAEGDDKAQGELTAMALSLLSEHSASANDLNTTASQRSPRVATGSSSPPLCSTGSTCPADPYTSCSGTRDGRVCGTCGLLTYASGVKPNGVDPRVAQVLLEDMLLGRAFEDKIAELYFKGIVSGFVHLYNGQEAVSTGIVKSLRNDDFVVSTYRDHVHALSKGVSAREVLAELSGKATGCSRGRGGSMHMFSKEKNLVGGFAYIGEQVPIALGLAYSIAYRRTLAGRRSPDEAAQHDQVVVVFTGDGSTNIGQFYESLNIAALAKLPLIFVVENNNWAIGMAHYRSTAVPEIAKRGAPFGVPSIEVDGMDVLTMRTAMEQAMTTARNGGGPTLIEALTYRFRGHSVADPDELRAVAEKQALLKRDPITKFVEEYMKPNGFIDEYMYRATKLKIRAVVEDAVQFTNSSPEPCPSTLENYVFAEKYKHPNEDGTDDITEEEMKQYADALKAELEFKKMSRAQKKAAPPFYSSTTPLRIID